MKKQLVLYSDQIRGVSDALDEALLTFLVGTEHKVAFVPAATDRNQRYFKRAQTYYAEMGIPSLSLFDADASFEPARVPDLLACDAIHLGAGDTEPFLAALRRNGLIAPLRAFAERGGVLIGMSAGAMLLAKSIAICGFRRDDATSRALGLVPFDFWPHYEGDARTKKALSDFATRTGRTVYACHDSEGLVVDGERVTIVGEPAVFPSTLTKRL